jgi:hypothetical protein
MPRIVISLFIIFAVGALNGALTPQSAHADSAAFTIENVRVDITSDNAVEAREKAFAIAQQQAFETLATRLLDNVDKDSFEMPPTEFIDTLVKDFEITDERVSPVRYIGTYTFRFKDDETRSYFKGSGVGYTDVKSRPVLVLPFYSYGARTVLWGPDNSWLQAWSRLSSSNGLVPIVVPIGDLQDVQDIGNDQALNYNTSELSNIVSRYGTGEAVVMLALPQWAINASSPNPNVDRDPDSLTVMFYRTDLGSPDLVTQIFVSKSDISSGKTIFDAGVKASVKALQNDWKKRTTVMGGSDNLLQVRVQFKTLDQWVQTQKALRTVQGINNVKLLQLSPSMATVEIGFSGSEQRLRLALAQSDMTLTAPQLDLYGTAGRHNPGYGLFNGQNRLRHSPLIYNLYLNKFYRR